MGAAQLVRLAGLLKALECVFAQGLQHPVALAIGPNEAAIDKRLQRVEPRTTYRFCGGEGAAAGEHSEACKQPPLLTVQELVAPVDRRAEGVLAAGSVPRP